MPGKRSLGSQDYRRLFGAYPTALAVVNQELLIQYVNANFTKLLPREGHVAGLSIVKVLPFEEIENLIRCAAREKKFKEAELQLRLTPRGRTCFKITIIPFGVPNKQDFLFLVCLEDVSERAHLEEQLLQAEKLSAMGQMAASITHELGNPLSMMITSLEYLRHSLRSSNRELQEQIETMEENAVRMHELLTCLADMSGLGIFHLEKEHIDRVILPVISFVSKMAEKLGITVKIDLGSELPPCRVDVRQLKQVFLNLLKNAMEAMPHGGSITVRSRHCPGTLSEEPGLVIVEVENTGKGVPSGDLENIFRPFYSTKKKGMGLGLSLCRGIIEKHGGKIRVSSQEGKGSCFIVEIPVHHNL